VKVELMMAMDYWNDPMRICQQWDKEYKDEMMKKQKTQQDDNSEGYERAE
jgi:hypothetical protein